MKWLINRGLGRLCVEEHWKITYLSKLELQDRKDCNMVKRKRQKLCFECHKGQYVPEVNVLPSINKV